MAGHSFPRAVLVLLALPLLIPAVFGAEVTIRPDSIVDRETISVSITNVTDGTLLNTTLVAEFPPVEGMAWFNLTNWNYPFALGKGMVAVRGQNVNQMVLLVRSGGTFWMRRDTGTGDITIDIPLDYPALTFHDFRIGYEVHSAKDPLVFTLVQEGTKAGSATDANLTPSVIGIAEGNLTVGVLANGTLLGAKEIRVLGAAPVPAPAPVVTQETPSAEPTPTPPAVEKTPAPTVPPQRTPAPRTTSTTPPATAGTPPTPAGIPSAGPSPFVIGYVAIIILVTIIADYLILKD